MTNFFAELKRRHIYRVAAAYAVVAWLLLQLYNNVAPILELPTWIGRAFLLLLMMGFPVALLFMWMRQLAPADGGAPRATTTKLDYVLIGALVLVIGLVSYQQLASAPNAPAPQQSGGIAIAVLPFANVSGDPSQEFFSDGMTDEIIAALTKISSLRVVGRESAFQYKGQRTDNRTVGQALGAAYLIEGSVRKAGERVRITAQLTRADTGVNLWAEIYDRELKDIFATQSDIGQAIAGALRVPLGLKQGDTLIADRTSDLESYQDYLRAKALYRVFKIEEAISVLEKVVARDPQYAPAWAMLGRLYRRAPVFGQPIPIDGFEEARRVIQASVAKSEAAARRAVQLDPKIASGYGALANIQYTRRNWAAAEDLFRQALVLDANDPDTLSGYSSLLQVAGRVKESERTYQQILALEPSDLGYKFAYTLYMQAKGENAASIPILEASPLKGHYGSLALASAYAAVGRYKDAADTLRAMPDDQIISRKLVEEASRLLRQAPTKVAAPDALPALGDLSFVYIYIGAQERVLDYAELLLNVDYSGGWSKILWFPEFAAVRKTDRFKAYVRKAGLVDYWRSKGWPDLCHRVGADDFACD